MQKILTAQAEPEMVLAKEVLLADGRVLCGKGTELTTGLIDRLIRMEVMQITVEGHPLQVEGEKSIKEQLRDIDLRFSRVGKIAPLMYLKNRIKERLVASLG